MNILYVANMIPFPLDGGGKIFTYSTIQALSNDNDIDLVCFYEHEDIEAGKKRLQDYCSTINTLPIRVTARENMPLMMMKATGSLFSKLPLGISKYITTDMKLLIKKKMSDKKYDCVFFNILAVYGYYDLIKSIDPQIKAILYEQNCEALIYKRYYDQTNNIFKKIFLKLEIKKLVDFENKAVNNVDRLIILSEEDRKGLKVAPERSEIIPIGVAPVKHCKSYIMEKTNKLKMLFVGTMTWTPNNEGIIWFLENVMPLCKDELRYELFIVGKNPSEDVKRLSESYNNVHLLGYVESLDSIYDECDVLVVPLFIGSGQRVKIIEAFSRGCAVISTSIGAEGLKYEDGTTILIADNVDQFKQKIVNCFDRNLVKNIGGGGKAVFDKEYSVDVITKKLNAAIKKCFV